MNAPKTVNSPVTATTPSTSPARSGSATADGRGAAFSDGVAAASPATPGAPPVAVGVKVVCCAVTPVARGRLVPSADSSTTVDVELLRLACARPIW